MPITFRFRGLDHAGKPVSGVVSADDAPEAIAQLKARDVHPTAIQPAESDAPAGSPGRRLKGGGRGMANAITIFTRQLANLVAGDVPLMAAFTALAQHTEHLPLRVVLEQMQQDVRGGKALWEALQQQHGIFSPLYVNMVKAGEASGQLASVLTWLADYHEKEQARRMQIRGALMYPALLTIAGTIAITLLIVLVVPKFAAMYSELEQALPFPTLVLLAITHFLGRWGWAVALGIILAVLLFTRYARTPGGCLRVDGLRLRLPIFGKLVLHSAMSRFARTTATLLQGGVPLLESLTVVRDVLGNEVLARATDRAHEGMREGERFAERLQQTGVFPGFLTHMIGIGEEVGDLQSMLITVAGTYDIEVDTTVKSLVSLLEPLIIITIGSIMGFIILAMLLPIFQINLLGS